MGYFILLVVTVYFKENLGEEREASLLNDCAWMKAAAYSS
jgi:hypothetical protein